MNVYQPLMPTFRLKSLDLGGSVVLGSHGAGWLGNISVNLFCFLGAWLWTFLAIYGFKKNEPFRSFHALDIAHILA